MTRYAQKARALSALVVLLALLVAAGALFSPAARASRLSRGTLLAVSVEEVSTVEIHGASSSLVFRRFGGAWTLEEGGDRLPARAERVEAFLDVVHSIHVLEEAGRTEAAWESLGLGDQEGRWVRLLKADGGVLADFHVGRYSPNAADVYIRKEGDARSYRVPASLSSRLPDGRKSWLDLRMFGEPIPVEDVQRLRVAGTLQFEEGDFYRENFILTRSASEGWVSREIPNLDPSAVERFIRSLLYSEADDFDEAAFLSPDEEGLRLDLELSEGTQRTLRISRRPEAGGVYRAALTGSGRVVRVPAWTLRNLLKTPEELQYKQP